MTDTHTSPDVDLPWDTLVARASAYAARAPRPGALPSADSTWAVDLEAGTLTVADGPETTTTPIQVAGTFDPAEGTWMWGWEHDSVPDDLALAASRLRTYGERQNRDDLTTSPVHADEELAGGYAEVTAYLWGASGVFAAPAGHTVAYLLIDGPDSGGVPGGVTVPDLIPARGLDRPRLADPDGIPLADEHLASAAPEFTAEQAVAVVVSYLRQLHPLHHLARDDNPTVEMIAQRTSAQEALRRAFWRRSDDLHDNAHLGFDHVFDVETMTDWDAHAVGARMWQVTWVRATPTGEIGEGYLVMLFDDAP